MEREFKRINVPFEYEVKQLDEEGVYSGYGSVFGVKDFDNDIVVAGAFAKTLGEWKRRKRLPPVIWQHDFRNPIGPHLEMEEDSKGLKLKGQLLIHDVQKAKEARALMKAKAVDGLSIGFMTRKAKRDEKLQVREILEVELLEVSIVTMGSNPKALVTDVKGISVDDLARVTSLKECEEILREAGFSVAAAKAFVAKCRSPREAGGGEAAAKLLASLKSYKPINNL